jgi:hypothetical protein
MWILIIFSALIGIIISILSNQLDTFLQSQGITGPIVLILLAPTMELIGGLSLIFSSGQPNENERKRLNDEANGITINKWPGLNPKAFQDQKDPIYDMLLLKMTINLEKMERRISIGFLSIGFLIQIFSILIKVAIPIIWFGLIMIIITVVLLFIILIGFPHWRKMAFIKAIYKI